MLQKYTAAQRPKVTVTADDKALFQYSGGTTGVPKAAVALHRNLVANTLQIRAWLSDCQEGKEVMLTAIPLFHVYGMVVGMLAAVQMAASIVVVPNPRDLESVVDAIDTYQPDDFPRRAAHVQRHQQLTRTSASTICARSAPASPVRRRCCWTSSRSSRR